MFGIGVGIPESAVLARSGTPTPSPTPAPTITSGNPSDAYDQGSTVGGTLTADETVTWSKSGPNAASLTLNTGTGVWSLDTSALGTLDITVTATSIATALTANQAWSFTIVAVATLPAPTLTWVSNDTTYDPVFSLTEITESDVAQLQIDDNSDFSSTYGDDTNTIDSAEALSGTVSFTGIPTLALSTTYYARARYTRGGSTSAWSTTVSKAMAGDTTAPTLSSPTDTANGATGATISVSTNEANGTLYWFISTSATPPTAANLKAGIGASATGNQAVSGTGVQNVAVTGLSPTTAYYTYLLHEDAASNQSAIAAADGFATISSGYDVFVLAGQSNMIGRYGPVDGTLDATDTDIQQWGYNGQVVSLAADPFDHDGETANTVGPGLSFAKAYKAAGLLGAGRKILLVPVAKGGQPISYWANGGAGDTAVTASVNAAMAAGSGTNLLKAILWHQGEGDFGRSEADYGADLDALIADWRASFTGASSATPFIVGELLQGGSQTDVDIVTALTDTPNRVRNTAFISSASLVGGADNIHFIATSQRTLGGRYYTGLATAISNNPAVPGAVANLSAIAGDAQVALAWSAPATNHSAITDYVVQYKLSASGTWSTFTDGTSGATGATVTGLTNAAAYDFRVYASNVAGQGAASNTATATPVSGATFNPLTIFSDYWDAGDEATITGAGDTLSLANQIGANAIVPNGTGQAFTTGDATKDVNGLNTLYTSGSAGRMRTAAGKVYSDTLHIFFAFYFDPTVYPTGAVLFSMGDNSDGTPRFQIFTNSGGTPVVRWGGFSTGGASGNCSTFPVSGTSIPPTGMHLMELRLTDNGNAEIWFDRALRYTTSGWTGFDGVAATIGLFYQIFSTNRSSGRVGSLAIKDGSLLTGTTLADAQSFFAARWGITLQ